MKTKDLIVLLQKEDPSGEIECCVGNADIYFVSTEPAYWDGRLQILERDESKKPYYHIVGAKRTSKGSKIVLHPYSIEDYISDNPEKAKIDYSECGNEDSTNRYRETDEKHRQLVLKMHLDMNIGNFYKWASGKLATSEIDSKPEAFKEYCAEFYIENRDILEELLELPPKEDKDGHKWQPSIYERELHHWENIIEFHNQWESFMKIKEKP